MSTHCISCVLIGDLSTVNVVAMISTGPYPGFWMPYQQGLWDRLVVLSVAGVVVFSAARHGAFVDNRMPEGYNDDRFAA